MFLVRWLAVLGFRTIPEAWALWHPKSLRIDALPSPSTVNSKAEVRFHLASADWIAEPVRQKIALTVPTPFLSLWIPGVGIGLWAFQVFLIFLLGSIKIRSTRQESWYLPRRAADTSSVIWQNAYRKFET